MDKLTACAWSWGKSRRRKIQKVRTKQLKNSRFVDYPLAMNIRRNATQKEMTDNTKHIRHGFSAVRPYLYGGLDLPDFVQQVFGAVELERHEFSERSFHYEARVGDSVI